jgi:hypothetical protein
MSVIYIFSRFLKPQSCQNMPGCALHYYVGLLLLVLFALLILVAASLLAIPQKRGPSGQHA